MRRIESVNTVREYSDERVRLGDERKLTVTPHWNHNDRVVIEIEGVKFTALAGDLRKAIDNAVNAHGW